MTAEDIRGLERGRIAVRNSFLIPIGFIVLMYVVTIVGAAITNNPLFMWVPHSVMAVALIYIFKIPYKKYRVLKEIYKEMVVGKAYKEAFSGAMYNATTGYTRDFVKETELVNLGNIYHSDDFVSANYKDVHFTRADVSIKNKSGGKNSSVVTYFEGRWLIIESNKNFKGDVQVISKGFFDAKKKTSSIHGVSRRHKVLFENEAFNEAYESYCQDDVEAFYLITPHMMENINRLKEVYQVPIMVAFIDQKVHVLVDTRKNATELNIFKKVDYDTVVTSIETEIKAVKETIEILRLDRDIFNA